MPFASSSSAIFFLNHIVTFFCSGEKCRTNALFAQWDSLIAILFLNNLALPAKLEFLMYVHNAATSQHPTNATDAHRDVTSAYLAVSEPIVPSCCTNLTKYSCLCDVLSVHHTIPPPRMEKAVPTPVVPNRLHPIDS